MRIWNILPLLEASAVTGMAIDDVVGRGKKRGKAVGSTLSRPENTSLFLRKEKDQKEIGVFLYLDFFQRIAQKKEANTSGRVAYNGAALQASLLP